MIFSLAQQTVGKTIHYEKCKIKAVMFNHNTKNNKKNSQILST